ncbi:hypothetical protein BJX62DRAFT_238170 [Aspergillus germanicus]
MEPAGLALGAVGLLGLFNLYQEAASVVHSAKNHSSESLRLFSRYNATKVLFERWGKQVGVADKDLLAQSVHPQLQDPATVNAVAISKLQISSIFGPRQSRVTPIHAASDCGHTDIVQLLLDAGVDVNIPASDGSTPLHYAVQTNRLAVVKLLLQNRASLDQQDVFGCTPFKYADEGTIAILREQVSDCEHYTHLTEDTRQQRMRKSIQTLCGVPIPLEKKDPTLLETLGRCLLKCRDFSAAAKVFNETVRLDKKTGKLNHDLICDECRVNMVGERWHYNSGRLWTLCAACMAKCSDGAERSFYTEHKFFCIPTSEWDSSRQTDVYAEDFVLWLKELQVQYGVAAL